MFNNNNIRLRALLAGSKVINTLVAKFASSDNDLVDLGTPHVAPSVLATGYPRVCVTYRTNVARLAVRLALAMGWGRTHSIG
jgi:hypothetical protein